MMFQTKSRPIHPALRNSVLSDINTENIFIICGYTDMRRSIDGLAATIIQSYKLDPCSRALYLFCGRKADRIKALLFEGDGFLLMYKRLENRGRYQWPRKESEARSITPQQLRWLLEGLGIDQPKAFHNVGSVAVI
jgi:transposase